MPRYQLIQMPVFVRPMPELPDPVEIAVGWVNSLAEQGFVNSGVALEWSDEPIETVTLDGLGDPTEVRGEQMVLLRSAEPGEVGSFEYRIVPVAQFVRPVPQMPDPVEIAIDWLNSMSEEGWINPDLYLEFEMQGEMEVVNLKPTVQVRGESHIFLRRPVING